MATKSSKPAGVDAAQVPFAMPRPSEDSIPRWSGVDSTVIRAFIAAFCKDGHAVLFGSTKDVTALTLTMYVAGNKVSYVYGHESAAEHALREYTEWAMSFAGYVPPQ